MRMIDQAQLSNQLNYIKFKRIVVMFEIMVFIVNLVLQLFVYMDPVARLFFAMVLLLRIMTELLNYHHFADSVNLSDHWLFLSPFA